MEYLFWLTIMGVGVIAVLGYVDWKTKRMVSEEFRPWWEETKGNEVRGDVHIHWKEDGDKDSL